MGSKEGSVRQSGSMSTHVVQSQQILQLLRSERDLILQNHEELWRQLKAHSWYVERKALKRCPEALRLQPGRCPDEFQVQLESKNAALVPAFAGGPSRFRLGRLIARDGIRSDSETEIDGCLTHHHCPAFIANISKEMNMCFFIR